MPLAKVSIAIPAYNREDLVQRAIESALAQTHPDIEVVVVDNCSTDRTFEVVQEYARLDQRVRCFRNDENIGPVRNWMKCLEYSTGEYIKFLFSDDWLEPHAVERYLAPLVEHREAGFSYSSAEIHYQTTGNTVRACQQETSRLMESFEFLRGQLIGTPSVPVSPGCGLFRRRDVEQGLEIDIPNRLGLDCSQRGIGPDLLLFLRICDTYPKVYYLGSVLSHFRGHEGSITISHGGSLCNLCYDVAFSWFLATSRLPVSQKRHLNALLLIRTLSSSRLKVLNYRNPWQAYSRMFPEQYNYSDMSLFSKDVAAMLYRKVVGRLRLTMRKGIR